MGKYAYTVYYVSGWTLSSAAKALTVASKKRAMYATFAKAHSLEMEEAKLRKLPTSVVERRKRRAKVYCTEAYYEFVCFVESSRRPFCRVI